MLQCKSFLTHQHSDFMNSRINKKKVFALLAVVVGLVVFQRELLIPLSKDVATKTDLFLVESKDQGSMFTQSNEMTQIAFQHCNTHLKEKIENESIKVTLPEKPLNAWSLGNYEYVVSAEADVVEGEKTRKQKYLCRISYKNGDDTSGAANFENWSLDGLSDLESNPNITNNQ